MTSHNNNMTNLGKQKIEVEEYCTLASRSAVSEYSLLGLLFNFQTLKGPLINYQELPPHLRCQYPGQQHMELLLVELRPVYAGTQRLSIICKSNIYNAWKYNNFMYMHTHVQCHVSTV